MNMKSATFIVVCLCAGFFTAPVLADDAANNAVKQCFLNMQSVHSYWMKIATITPGLSQADQDSVIEETEDPPRTRAVIMVTAVKYENETVTTDNAIYIRINGGSWQAQTITMPKSVSWGASWGKEYNPHSIYVFKRKDTLGSIPVDVYSTTGIVDGQQTYTEIWIGVKDHLPHEILTHSVQADKIEHYATQTFSDFNTPIKIDVPDVTPSDASTPETTPDSGHQ